MEKDTIITCPIKITKTSDSNHSYLVYIPDTRNYTEGDSILDAMKMARDSVGLIYSDAKQIPNNHYNNLNSHYLGLINQRAISYFKYNKKKSLMVLVRIDLTKYNKKVQKWNS